ncbi:MAG: hypothetical protein LAN83_04300 [Acidobacteriia bacterium]|nr:hypothetical protein [Terriglobia bacterium]
MPKVRTFVLTALAAFILGLPAGYAWSYKNLVLSEKFLNGMLATAGYANSAFWQYKEADPERGRQALLGFLDFTQRMQKLPWWGNDRPTISDQGLTYMRLAFLEKSAGNASLAHDYVLKAQERFKTAGHPHSESELWNMVSKIDSNARP